MTPSSPLTSRHKDNRMTPQGRGRPMTHVNASTAGRAQAAQRRRVTGTGPVCGRQYKGAPWRRYCSEACRSQAYRRRPCAARQTAWPRMSSVTLTDTSLIPFHDTLTDTCVAIQQVAFHGTKGDVALAYRQRVKGTNKTSRE